MIANKKEFYAGFGLIVIFTIVLIILFMPVFGGKNALENLDMLYNSISKGSAYYIPKAKKEAKPQMSACQSFYSLRYLDLCAIPKNPF